MVCKHCGEKTNICPYCLYGMDENSLEEFSVCPKCGSEIDRCAYCGQKLKCKDNIKLDKKSILIQKIIGYIALFFIVVGIIYLFFIAKI